MTHRPKSDQLLSRAIAFANSSLALIEAQPDGWVTSSLLLQGFSAELAAKKRLLDDGHDEKTLTKDPFGHDILYMWRDATSLLSFASSRNADFPTHFQRLSKMHTRETSFAIRYGGEVTPPDPRILGPTLTEVLKIERMR